MLLLSMRKLLAFHHCLTDLDRSFIVATLREAQATHTLGEGPLYPIVSLIMSPHHLGFLGHGGHSLLRSIENASPKDSYYRIRASLELDHIEKLCDPIEHGLPHHNITTLPSLNGQDQKGYEARLVLQILSQRDLALILQRHGAFTHAEQILRNIHKISLRLTYHHHHLIVAAILVSLLTMLERRQEVYKVLVESFKTAGEIPDKISRICWTTYFCEKLYGDRSEISNNSPGWYSSLCY